MTKFAQPNPTVSHVNRSRYVLLAAGLMSAGLLSALPIQAERAEVVTQVAANSSTPDPRTPFFELSRAIRAGNLVLALHTALPPSQIYQLRLAYDLHRQKPVSESERAEFADGVGKLTAPGAVDQMMAEIEPKLAEARPKAAGALLMGLGALQVALASDDNKLTADQRLALQQAYPNIQRWASSTDFLSAETMRRALTLMTNAARNTGVRSADDLKHLSLEDALSKAGVMFTAGKQAAQLYGLDVNAIADSLQVSVVKADAQTAKVRTTITVFGAPISSDHEMVMRAGRWYGVGTMSFDLPKQASR